MNVFRIGRFKVVEHEKYSNILRKPKDTDLKQNVFRLKDDEGMILVDEIVGKNHYTKACKKAKLWDEADNPSEEKKELNRKLVAIWNRDSKTVSDTFFLDWSIKNMKKELDRLENILSKGDKDAI